MPTTTTIIYNIIYSSSMKNDIDTNAIKELGLNHVKNAYSKINKENSNKQNKETRIRNTTRRKKTSSR